MQTNKASGQKVPNQTTLQYHNLALLQLPSMTYVVCV